MCKFNAKVEHVPNYKEYFAVIGALTAVLRRQDIKADLLWDNKFYYVSLEEWNEIFLDVMKNMPKYTTDKFDCENFALLTVARITEKYKLNGIGIAIGDSPLGYHGWNIFITSPFELLYFEPQTGQVIELDDDYKAHYVVWG